jgi:hypothetical protein
VTHDSAPALHTCLPIYHAHVPLTVNDTRFIAINADYTCLHIWAAQDAKHLLTTTPTTHDRPTRGNFGLAFGPEARPDPLVNPERVRRALALHRAGRYDFGKELWSVLTLDVWARLFLDGAEPSSLSFPTDA